MSQSNVSVQRFGWSWVSYDEFCVVVAICTWNFWYPFGTESHEVIDRYSLYAHKFLRHSYTFVWMTILVKKILLTICTSQSDLSWSLGRLWCLFFMWWHGVVLMWWYGQYHMVLQSSSHAGQWYIYAVGLVAIVVSGALLICIHLYPGLYL